ncbi:RecX family transcriptional regulator [Candidatus Dojkabacteria bacterium]|uniref:Regulatory protein RecX n=1 Tax=Candidatus Dojkabacteria bacterium TaxID=2099670 RepID=A0A955L4I1_9BACT|nr:RecX family transcriptional regulator [Candidatus Dojkabacteria bacterium]
MKSGEITALQRGVKSRNVNIYIDGEYSFSVVDNTVVEFKLFKGKKLNEDEIRGIVKKDIESRYYYRAIDRILSRPRSEFEIRKYLKEKISKSKYKDKIDESVIENVISRLRDNQYLDDYAFAIWWLENRIAFKSKSKLELKMELSTKAVSPDVIEKAVAEIVDSDSEKQMALDLVEKRMKSLSGKNISKVEKLDRVKKYLQRKGYSWDIIKQVI